MKKKLLDRPQKVYNKFPEESLKTIRDYVKEWKNNNREKVISAIYDEIEKCIQELGLSERIFNNTMKYLKKYISKNNPALNMEWRGIIAGAI